MLWQGYGIAVDSPDFTDIQQMLRLDTLEKRRQRVEQQRAEQQQKARNG